MANGDAAGRLLPGPLPYLTKFADALSNELNKKAAFKSMRCPSSSSPFDPRRSRRVFPAYPDPAD